MHYYKFNANIYQHVANSSVDFWNFLEFFKSIFNLQLFKTVNWESSGMEADCSLKAVHELWQDM